MTTSDWAQLAVALVLVIFAGFIAAAEAGLSSFSKSRADRLVEEGVSGAPRVRKIADDPPRYLNTALFLRTLVEISAITIVAKVVFSFEMATWQAGAITAGAMTVVSYIFWGVAPRTLGRQHAQRVACSFAGPLVAVTTVLGPFPRLLILIGNALTPGKGFTDGPFATEAELRELVDLAEASEVIESGERRMIHSVFDLGDTIVREVMVPRTDMVFIEEYKTLRQAVSLALRSGFSRIPVVRDGLDDVVGVLYLKDVIKRVYDTPDAQSNERVGSMMRKPVWCPDSKPVDELLQEMQAKRVHLVIVVDEFGGTAGMATIEDILEEIVGEIVDEYDEENTDITPLGEGRFRVSSRLPVDELGDLFGLKLDDEDVETVGGLMAKQLNKVPIAGSVVKYDGLELVAERSSGRRNRIGTVVATRIEPLDVDEDARADAATQIAQAGGTGLVTGPAEPSRARLTPRTSRSSAWPAPPWPARPPGRAPAYATPTAARTRRPVSSSRTSTCRRSRSPWRWPSRRVRRGWRRRRWPARRRRATPTWPCSAICRAPESSSGRSTRAVPSRPGSISDAPSHESNGEPFRSGFACFVGRPNAGKSTLDQCAGRSEGRDRVVEAADHAARHPRHRASVRCPAGADRHAGAAPAADPARRAAQRPGPLHLDRGGCGRRLPAGERTHRSRRQLPGGRDRRPAEATGAGGDRDEV